jgi:hypothetical protein
MRGKDGGGLPDVEHICCRVFPHLTQGCLEFLAENEQLVPVLLPSTEVEIVIFVLIVRVVEVDVDLLDASCELLAQTGSCEFTGTLQQEAVLDREVM